MLTASGEALHTSERQSPRSQIDVIISIVKQFEGTLFVTIFPPFPVKRAVRQECLRTYPILAPRIVRHIMRSASALVLNASAEALIRSTAEELKTQSTTGPVADKVATAARRTKPLRTHSHKS
jgi:hypothetical protein